MFFEKLINVLFYVPLIVLTLWVVLFIFFKLDIYKPKIEIKEKYSLKQKIIISIPLISLICFGLYYKTLCNQSCKNSINEFIKGR
jgi:hypothetical protein